MPEVYFNQRCAMQISVAQVGVLKRGSVAKSAIELGGSEVRSGEHGALDVRSGEHGAFKLGFLQQSVLQVHTDQGGPVGDEVLQGGYAPAVAG